MEELILINVMASDVSMVIDGRKGPKVFLEPFPKGPCRFPYVLLITMQFVTLIPVDSSSFCVVSILGATRRFLMVLLPLK